MLAQMYSKSQQIDFFTLKALVDITCLLSDSGAEREPW